MTNTPYDVAVIGAGPGGYIAALRAAQLGLKTVCIEKEKTLGGTCLNVGCIPSKTLLHTTEYYSWIQQESKELGINCQGASLDFAQMMQRKQKVINGLVEGIAGLFKRSGVVHLEGNARFVDAKKLEISGKEKQIVEAKHFILATGSEPIPLPFATFDEKTIISSTGALSLSSIPKKMVVIGGGVIGVELASVYRRLGTEIVIIEMLERICPTMDEGVSKALLQILKKQGMTFHLGAKVTAIKKEKNGVIVTVGSDQHIEADLVLCAVGRRPFSTGLGLNELGIKMQRGFVEVDVNFRSSIPNIYAIGDLIEGPMLAHRASEEGRVVAELIAHKSPEPKINYMAIPNVIYTHPEVASIGLTEKEAREMGLKIRTGTAYFRGNARARCNGYTEGFVKVIGAGPNNVLVGMHIIGAQASELIAEGMIAIEKRATLQDIADAPNAHPTLSETIKEASLEALNAER